MAATVTVVSVWDNPLSDITALKKLPKLETVRLKGTKVTDLSPLAGLPNLNEVDIRNTPVTDVTPLKNSVKLTRLYVGESQISVEKAKEQLAKLVANHDKGAGEQTQLSVDSNRSPLDSDLTCKLCCLDFTSCNF